VGFSSFNHQTATRIKQEYRQNSYVQNIDKAMQYVFAERCAEQSAMTLDVAAEHTNPP
jgi:hypothetical protein